MNAEYLFSQVKITNTGAIGLGKSVVCDGFVPGYRAAAFTHIHSDHLSGDFEACMHRYNVYMSKVTADLFEALKGEKFGMRTQFHALDYDSKRLIKLNGDGDYLVLKESKHVFAASQILLHTHDKLSIMYSGDVSPYDEPERCDILVVDSTHGDPKYDKVLHEQSLDGRFLDFVSEQIERGRPVAVHAYRGKLQYLMHVLSEHGPIPDSVAFMASKHDINMARVYRSYGKHIRDLMDMKKPQAYRVFASPYPWIEFHASGRRTNRERSNKVASVSMMGKPDDEAMIDYGDDKVWIAPTTHAEHTGLLDYVKKANPGVVVTDNHRTKHGETLADAIRTGLGIPARAMPIKQ